MSGPGDCNRLTDFVEPVAGALRHEVHAPAGRIFPHVGGIPVLIVNQQVIDAPRLNLPGRKASQIAPGRVLELIERGRNPLRMDHDFPLVRGEREHKRKVRSGPGSCDYALDANAAWQPSASYLLVLSRFWPFLARSFR